MSRVSPFGELLRQYRVAAGLSQEELAEKANLSPRTISDLERGVSRAPHRPTVELLAEALELEAEERADLAGSVLRRRKVAQLVAAPLGKPQARLARAPTPLLGRERDEAQVAHLLLRAGNRLLTLTGPPGVGKTRLAQRVVDTTESDFPDGVFEIGLASIEHPSLVPAVVADAVGLREGNDDGLFNRLGEKQALLVLDNFEHLMAAAPFVAELLASSSHLKVLVTSRSALLVRGEQEFSVPPLGLPEGTAEEDDPMAYPAVALFLQRARAATPSFDVDPSQIPVLCEICRHLGGVPLAIELASARVKVLPLEAIRERLAGGGPEGYGLNLLAGGPRDLPERQRSMRRVIGWSYDMLPPKAQTLFPRLSVFLGGFTLEAAEAVCGHGSPPMETLDELTALVDASMVVPAGTVQGERRFGLLETLRQYGQEQLSAAEAESLRARHVTFYRGLAERVGPELTGSDEASWRERLDCDHDILRAAGAWALQQGDGETAVAIGSSLQMFWFKNGYVREGLDLLRAGLAGLGPESVTPRANALEAAGFLAWISGESAEARAWLEEGAELCRRSRDQGRLAWALIRLSNLDDPARVRQKRLAEALELARGVGDRTAVCRSLMNLGSLALERGQYARAAGLLEEAHELLRTLGPADEQASARNMLAWAAIGRGRLRQAETILRQTLNEFRSLGDRRGVGSSLHALGWVRLASGKPAKAAELMREAMVQWQEGGLEGLLPYSFQGLACAEAAAGEPEQAAFLFGAAHELSQRLGSPLWRYERDRGEICAADVRSSLGEDGWVFARNEAAGMTASQVVRRALA